MYHIDMIYTIKTLSEKGKSQRAISKELSISRRTVRKYLELIQKAGVKEPHINKLKKLNEFKEFILDWLERGLTAQLIFDRLKSMNNIDVSYPTVSRFVKTLKCNEVFVPLISKPGEEAQVDYGYMGRFNKDGKEIKVWCFVMTLSFSRLKYVELVTSQNIESFLLSHVRAFEFFSGVPVTVKIDNLKSGVISPNFYESEIQTQYAEFLKYYGSAPITARVRRPQDKGKVEAGVKYVKNNFLKNIENKDFFQSQDDLKKWVNRINQKVHGTTKKVPLEQFMTIEKQKLIALPDIRYEIYRVSKRKVNNYSHITFENNYYSAPCQFVGKEVIVKYNQNTLKIFFENNQIALHAIADGMGNFITSEHHKPAYKQYKNKEYYLDKAEKIGIETFEFCKQIVEIKPNDYQRLVNGIFHLAKIYGNCMVNGACKRSIEFGVFSYISIKNISKKNLDNIPTDSLVVENAKGYYQDLKMYDNLSFN